MPTPVPPGFDHVALLVDDVERAADALAPLGLQRTAPRTFDGEGTREIYLGDESRQGRLLLVESVRDDGPYGRALARRGPGLHHVCMSVADLDPFVEGLWGTAWMLHPMSIRTIRASRTAWLARRGVGTLVEVQETAERVSAAPAVVRRVAVPTLLEPDGLFDPFPGVPLVATGAPGAVLEIGDARVCVTEL